MFFDDNKPERARGKRTGIQASGQGLSLGWDVSSQHNEFQVRKQQKSQNMATKVTDGCGDVGPSPTQGALTFEEKCKQLILAYPNITTEQLQDKMALWEASPNTLQARQPVSSKPASVNGSENRQRPGSKATAKRNAGSFALGDGYNYWTDPDNKK